MLPEGRDPYAPTLIVGGLQSHMSQKVTPSPAASYQQCDFKEASFSLCALVSLVIKYA